MLQACWARQSDYFAGWLGSGQLSPRLVQCGLALRDHPRAFLGPALQVATSIDDLQSAFGDGWLEAAELGLGHCQSEPDDDGIVWVVAKSVGPLTENLAGCLGIVGAVSDQIFVLVPDIAGYVV